MIRSTMQRVPLSSNTLLERAGKIFRNPKSSPACPTSRCAAQLRGVLPPHAAPRRGAAALGLHKGDRVATLCWNHHAHLECYFGIPGGRRRDAHAQPAARARRDRLDRQRRGGPLPHRRRRACCRCTRSSRTRCKFEKVIVVPLLGRAGRAAHSLDYEQLLAAAPARLRLRRRTTRTIRSRCATRRAPPAGRRASCTRTARRCCTRWSAASADHWGLRGTDGVLPVTPMFHANCWGMPYGAVMMGVKLVFPGPHLHPRRPARPDAARAADARARRADDLDGLDPGCELARRGSRSAGTLPPGMRSLVGGAAVPESLIRALRAARRLDRRRAGA